MTAPPSVLDNLVGFIQRLHTYDDVDPDLLEVMEALMFDAVAAAHAIEDQFDEILRDGE